MNVTVPYRSIYMYIINIQSFALKFIRTCGKWDFFTSSMWIICVV